MYASSSFDVCNTFFQCPWRALDNRRVSLLSWIHPFIAGFVMVFTAAGGDRAHAFARRVSGALKRCCGA
jgi:hypothetical protein